MAAEPRSRPATTTYSGTIWGSRSTASRPKGAFERHEPATDSSRAPASGTPRGGGLLAHARRRSRRDQAGNDRGLGAGPRRAPADPRRAADGLLPPDLTRRDQRSRLR